MKNIINPPAIIQEARQIEWEEAISLGLELREQKDNVQWSLGGLASRVAKSYGEDSIGEFAKAINIPKNTLREYRRIVKKFPLGNQEPMLCFRHYQVAAGQEHPEKWIKEAADNVWTSEQLAVKIKQSREPEYEPRPQIRQCSFCKKYYLDSDNVCTFRGRHQTGA